MLQEMYCNCRLFASDSFDASVFTLLMNTLTDRMNVSSVLLTGAWHGKLEIYRQRFLFYNYCNHYKWSVSDSNEWITGRINKFQVYTESSRPCGWARIKDNCRLSLGSWFSCRMWILPDGSPVARGSDKSMKGNDSLWDCCNRAWELLLLQSITHKCWWLAFKRSSIPYWSVGVLINVSDKSYQLYRFNDNIPLVGRSEKQIKPRYLKSIVPLLTRIRAAIW